MSGVLDCACTARVSHRHGHCPKRRSSQCGRYTASAATAPCAVAERLLDAATRDAVLPAVRIGYCEPAIGYSRVRCVAGPDPRIIDARRIRSPMGASKFSLGLRRGAISPPVPARNRGRWRGAKGSRRRSAFRSRHWRSRDCHHCHLGRLRLDYLSRPRKPGFIRWLFRCCHRRHGYCRAAWTAECRRGCGAGRRSVLFDLSDPLSNHRSGVGVARRTCVDAGIGRCRCGGRDCSPPSGRTANPPWIAPRYTPCLATSSCNRSITVSCTDAPTGTASACSSGVGSSSVSNWLRSRAGGM